MGFVFADNDEKYIARLLIQLRDQNFKLRAESAEPQYVLHARTFPRG